MGGVGGWEVYVIGPSVQFVQHQCVLIIGLSVCVTGVFCSE